MTCENLIQYFAKRPYVQDSVFSYPGNEDCFIDSTNQIFYDSELRPMNHGETSYWASCGCDIPNGIGFLSAQELFSAPIYGGRSIRGRWGEIIWHEIDGWMTPEQFDVRSENEA